MAFTSDDITNAFNAALPNATLEQLYGVIQGSVTWVSAIATAGLAADPALLNSITARFKLTNELLVLQSKQTNINNDKQAVIREKDAELSDVARQIKEKQDAIDALGASA